MKHFDAFSASVIQNQLRTKSFGRELCFRHSLSSTNLIAREFAKLKDTPEGFLVVAEIQTRGKGRWDRNWFSPQGGLWFSLILRPTLQKSQLAILPLLAGLSVTETIRGLSLDAKIRWPNDVLIGSKKVCGILSETSLKGDAIRYSVIGVGINVNFHASPDLDPVNATTLLDEVGYPLARADLLANILLKMEYYYGSLLNHEDIVNKTAILTETLGRRVRVSSLTKSINGRAVALDKSGALILETNEGELLYVRDMEVKRLRTPANADLAETGA